jgi:hypothetical protein
MLNLIQTLHNVHMYQNIKWYDINMQMFMY